MARPEGTGETDGEANARDIDGDKGLGGPPVSEEEPVEAPTARFVGDVLAGGPSRGASQPPAATTARAIAAIPIPDAANRSDRSLTLGLFQSFPIYALGLQANHLRLQTLASRS